MNDIKEELRVRLAAEKGIKISNNDPINILIDIIILWIKENNKALIADLIKKANHVDSIEKRERLKQAKYTSDIIAKIPLKLDTSQKKTIREQVHLAMAKEVERIKPQLWWKRPSILIGGINFAVNIGILIALIMI